MKAVNSATRCRMLLARPSITLISLSLALSVMVKLKRGRWLPAGIPTSFSIQGVPIPEPYRDLGLRRFGFHGSSCESILVQLAPRQVSRLVIAHLGGGSSVTAVRHGQSVDTSMGLTPMGGIVMNHRSGDVDPGIVFYLMRERNLSLAAVEDLLGSASGLSAISATDGDMSSLQRSADEGNSEARLALEIFAYSTAKFIAGAAVVLNGIDLLVFTGGVGEHGTAIREQIIGLVTPVIGRAEIKVLSSGENKQIARHTMRLIG